MRGGAVTFAVLGHNEAELLPNMLAQVCDAAGPGDTVWFADSESTDRSAEIARAHGIGVVRVPLGKGNAVADVLRRCTTKFLCLLDADVALSEVNIPRKLVRALEGQDAQLVIGQFNWLSKPLHAATIAIYTPLIRGLFAEADGQCGRVPLSGFRILDTELQWGELPPRFGLEAYLNARCASAGGRIAAVELGDYDGPVRDRRKLGFEVADALLGLAERLGRLDPALRPDWEAWVASAMNVVTSQPTAGRRSLEQFRAQLEQAAARPLPAARRAVRA